MTDDAYEELISTLLEKRGVGEKQRADFLRPDYDAHVHDPALLADIEKAVDRVMRAIDGGERVAVYADFDCDGIPAAVVLYDFFKKVGHENVEVYIPHRHNEGYGFHKEAVEQLAKRGVSLIITVDVGTTAVETVAYADELGVDVIVTDHHEVEDVLPSAVAVVNPKREGYPFQDLCGAAVAFKMVQATLAEGKRRRISAFTVIPEGWEKWLLDMVGIATIADMVPLVGENRVLARFGLMVLRKSPRVGVHALCRKLNIRQQDISEDDIGFLVAPRINAASRMDEPELAFTLLATREMHEAEEAVRKLEALNRSRKGVVGSIVREARKRLEDRDESARVSVIGDPSWRPALLGLVANSLLESRSGAVCVWGRDGRGHLTGSCRSDGSVGVVDLFNASADSLEVYGGHACAGGFTVSHEHVHTLHNVMNSAADGMEKSGSEKGATSVYFDADISLDHVSWHLWEQLSRLAPFGMGNPKPVFRLLQAQIVDVRVFGKEKNHTEVTLTRGAGKPLRALQFFRTPDDFTYPPVPDAHVTVFATLERDTFRGPRALALRIVDITS